MASAAKQYLGAGGLLWSFNRANAQAMQFGQTMADVAAITELNVDKMAKSLLKLDHIFGTQTGYHKPFHRVLRELEIYCILWKWQVRQPRLSGLILIPHRMPLLQ